MQHFSYLKTSITDLLYLKKVLHKLNILFKEEKQNIEQSKSNISNVKLVIPQSNGYNIEFNWNGHEYELPADRSFWEQSYSPETFIDKIAQKYAYEVIVEESQKIGFKKINADETSENVTTIVLERWN